MFYFPKYKGKLADLAPRSIDYPIVVLVVVFKLKDSVRNKIRIV